jgi:hypothetical protein
MKMTKFSFMSIVLLPIVLTGCMTHEVPEKDGFPIVVAIERSTAFANKDAIDWTEYSVRSAELSVNGWTSVIDRESKDPDDASVVQKLQGKEYWEICYGTIVPGLVGATYCYYLERSSYKLLAALNRPGFCRHSRAVS